MTCLAWAAFAGFLATAELDVRVEGRLIWVLSREPRLWVARPGGACHGGVRA